MTFAAYLTNCPLCGADLQPVALGPANAPWLCIACRKGWFAAELAPDARQAWLPAQGHHHRKSGVREAVTAELELAHRRGTSVRMDQVHRHSARTLRALPSTVAPELAAAIAEHLAKEPTE